MPRAIRLINAPSNLGLRPLTPGHEPGTWAAPASLAAAGLAARIGAAAEVTLPRPAYAFEPPAGSTWLNGPAIRSFNEKLRDAVAASFTARQFPLVIGGDCSILIGCLAAARARGPLALVHLDGHSDFRHAGNWDSTGRPGTLAGADLAIAIGKGDAFLTDWGQAGPLVEPARAIQIGERESRDPAWPWGDIAETGITLVDIFRLRDIGLDATIALARDTSAGLPFWLHLDVDIMDQLHLPAVDSPGSPGLDYAETAALLRPLLADPQCLGLDMTIFDPEQDPDGAYARRLVDMLAAAFA